PDLCFAFYDRMVIFDHINKTIAAVAHAHVQPRDLEGCYRTACARVDRLVERLQQGVADLQLTDIAPIGEVHLPYRSNFEPGAFEDAVRKCKEYIKAGDIFQVVLSQRLETTTKARPFDIYRTLRVVNPSPFMFYVKAGPLCLVGSSPEIMVRVEDDRVLIRPLAGTRRRGKTEEEDERLAAELLADPKVRAMQIIDELEPQRRGPYGGAVGYIDFSGNMDTCIALRTLVLKGQTAYLQAGAGIVADSVPELEREETLNKAMGLLRALEIAETQL